MAAALQLTVHPFPLLQIQASQEILTSRKASAAFLVANPSQQLMDRQLAVGPRRTRQPLSFQPSSLLLIQQTTTQ